MSLQTPFLLCQTDAAAVSVDLPLSNEGKRVLTYAAEEADLLSDEHIGTEHLSVGLLREKESFAAQLLNSQGLSLERARKIVRKGRRAPDEELVLVKIHGEDWDLSFLQPQLAELRRYVWRKRQWKALDMLVESSTGRIFFDMTP